MTTPDLAAIVRGLTKAQREAILWCNDGWKERDKACPRSVSFYILKEVRKGNPRCEVSSVFSLIDVDAVRIINGRWAPDRYGLTPLGTQVRSHLLSETNDADR